jgi:large subunit ribosomal protein L24
MAKRKSAAARPKRRSLKVRSDDRVQVMSGKGQNTAAQLGGVIELEGPIHISNVMLVDAKGKPTRVGIQREAGGERVRVAKSSGARLD